MSGEKICRSIDTKNSGPLDNRSLLLRIMYRLGLDLNSPSSTWQIKKICERVIFI